ncbi:hypothetical protein BG653_05641 [Streptomyces platensis]|uniref:Secreted protein n=1 Tax=Streptomyces platensis TaxID=58346 RepID=A0ABX3XQ84_STRPT|nr:hypothetical protein BG653_05641 [Streptomyces platensis]
MALVYVCAALATPPAAATVTGVVPSPKSKVTIPVGAAPPMLSDSTLARNVTGWPVTEGSGSPLTVVVVAAGPTVCVPVPVEGLKSASPL